MRKRGRRSRSRGGTRNEIRKQKRVVDALNAAGYDAREANARLNAIRHRLRRHIAENDAILHRERHREQLYDSAARMKKAKLVTPPPAPKMPSAPKAASVSGNAFEKAVQTVAARGVGATVITAPVVVEHKSVGAARRYSKFKGIKLGKQEEAILRAEYRRYYKSRIKGKSVVEYPCETVGGAYNYTIMALDENNFIVLKKVAIK